MYKSVLFTNSTDEDFSCKWDSQIMVVKSGETLMMEAGVAYHFARHLAVRELNKDNKPTDKASVLELASTYTSEDAVVAKSEAELETKILTSNSKKAPKKETKKEVKKEVKKEKEFEDLD